MFPNFIYVLPYGKKLEPFTSTREYSPATEPELDKLLIVGRKLGYIDFNCVHAIDLIY
jgi:hypothetical protein